MTRKTANIGNFRVMFDVELNDVIARGCRKEQTTIPSGQRVKESSSLAGEINYAKNLPRVAKAPDLGARFQ
jgi:hypothetical protein